MSTPLGGAVSTLVEPEADERLARRAADGDPQAFEEIFCRYQQDLYRFCVGILREPQDAQDAVQNTMVKALRALPGETREMQLKPWLYRIAHNEAVELRRRKRPVEALEEAVDVAALVTEEQFELEGRLRTLLADIADLPERQRAALVMRELSGLGFGEIGAALGTSSGAARQALYEARRGLSQMESGRELDCDLAMRQLSDADGAPTQRGIRAHLRDCFRCRRFQTEIHGRRETLAAISPMPVLVAAGLWKGALGAAGGGKAVGLGGSATAVGGSATGAAGAAGAGGLGTGGAGALGVSGLVKAAAGVIAAVAVGTVAIDHSGPFGQGADPARAGARPAQTRTVERPATVGAAAAAPRSTAASRRIVAAAAAPTVADRLATKVDRAAAPVAPEQTARPAAPEQAPSPSHGPISPVPASVQATDTGARSPGDTRGDQGTPGDGAEAGVGGETKDAAETQPESTQTKSEANAEKAEAKVEKKEAQAATKAEKAEARSEAKAERAEAKAEAKAEKAEAKAEKAEAKAEAKGEKAEAKAERSEAKAERPEPKQDPTPPEAPAAEPPATEASEPPVETAPGKSGQPHGKSGKGETAPAE